MNRNDSFQVFVGVILLVVAQPADAGIIEQWKVADGGNGHFYELVELPSPISWTDARDAASTSTHLGSNGHLVTLNSAAEDAFLKSKFENYIGDPNTSVPGIYAWIGLSDAAQEGNYQWVTGEPFTYSNWAPPEPNNLGDEDYVWVWRRKFTGTSIDPNGTITWSWNDGVNSGPYHPSGYFVEYDGPFTPPVPEPTTFVMALIAAAGARRTLRRRNR